MLLKKLFVTADVGDDAVSGAAAEGAGVITLLVETEAVAATGWLPRLSTKSRMSFSS